MSPCSLLSNFSNSLNYFDFHDTINEYNFNLYRHFIFFIDRTTSTNKIDLPKDPIHASVGQLSLLNLVRMSIFISVGEIIIAIACVCVFLLWFRFVFKIVELK